MTEWTFKIYSNYQCNHLPVLIKEVKVLANPCMTHLDFKDVGAVASLATGIRKRLHRDVQANMDTDEIERVFNFDTNEILNNGQAVHGVTTFGVVIKLPPLYMHINV